MPESSTTRTSDRNKTLKPRSKQAIVEEDSEDEEEAAREKDRRSLPVSQESMASSGKWLAPSKGTAKPTTMGLTPFVQVPARSTQPLGTFRPVNVDKEPPKKVAFDLSETVETIPDPKRGAAFKRRAPIEDQKALESIVKQIQELVLPVSFRSLVSVSPHARKFIQRLLTEKRIPAEVEDLLTPKAQQVCQELLESPNKYWRMWQQTQSLAEDIAYVEAHDPQEYYEEEWPGEAEIREQQYIDINDLPPAQIRSSNDTDQVKDEGLIISDPVEQYYMSCNVSTDRRPIVVAREAHSLRVVYPHINNSGVAECMLDGGSQICSIHLEEAKRLGLAWDSEMTILLTAANNSTSPTLGLARNVPIKFGNTVAYLQLHVVDGVPYKVLIGRPFETVMAAKIENQRNGDQLLTLTDPNTGIKVTMPTYEKGKAPAHIKEILQAQERASFQSSMIRMATSGENSQLPYGSIQILKRPS